MKRRGITLTEALVALFIAALGMISLLTLFPLGALTTGQALRDARTTNAAAEADGLLRWYWNKYEVNYPNSPILQAFELADYSTAQSWMRASASPGLNNDAASYPVLLDPIGFHASTSWPTLPPLAPTPPAVNPPFEAAPFNGTQRSRVALHPTFPRRTLGPIPTTTAGVNFFDVNTASKTLRMSMLQDDISYSDQQTGTPGLNVERGGRYTWAWLLQKPNLNRPVINVRVVVFDQRAPFYANSTTEVPFIVAGTDPRSSGEIAFYPGSTRLTIPYGNATRPQITRGRWIMDATIGLQGSFTGSVANGYFIPPTHTPPSSSQTAPTSTTGTPSVPLRHANFYRVVSVNDETPGYLDIELETPIRRNDGVLTPYQGTVIVLNGVVEVFERPPLNPAP